MDEIKKRLEEIERKIDTLHEKLDKLSEEYNGADDLLSKRPEVDENEFIEAVFIVVEHDKASSSLLQRRMQIGFNRAARIIEALEYEGVISPANGAFPREVLINDAKEFLLQYLDKDKN